LHQKIFYLCSLIKKPDMMKLIRLENVRNISFADFLSIEEWKRHICTFLPDNMYVTAHFQRADQGEINCIYMYRTEGLFFSFGMYDCVSIYRFLYVLEEIFYGHLKMGAFSYTYLHRKIEGTNKQLRYAGKSFDSIRKWFCKTTENVSIVGLEVYFFNRRNKINH
jgi:hypothetical protein